MDKQDSHPNENADKIHQKESGEMSTHGEIHKQKMTPGSASLSLDSTLTSALSRAPSPFASHEQVREESQATASQEQVPHRPAPVTPASQSPAAQAEAQYTAPPRENGYPSAPQEPHFGKAPSQPANQEPAGEHHYEPSFDDMYTPEQHAEPQAGYPYEQAQETPEQTTYPAQYNQYHDGMSDVFDENTEKPNSSRTSFILLASLALVAIIAGGVIYFYKSQTTDVAARGEVPVIKAEEKPTKITPEKPGGIQIPHQKKLIYDRITGENSEGSEQIVPRQEAVVPVSPQSSTGNPFDQQQPSTGNALDTPVAAPDTSLAKAKPVLPPSVETPPAQVAAPEPIAIAPTPVAPAPSPAPVSSSGDYLIQIASFRTQEEAIRNYENLSRKYSGLLSSYGPLIQKADLGTRGIYYRLRIGPMDSKQTAQNLCNNLVAQGQKDCLVRKK